MTMKCATFSGTTLHYTAIFSVVTQRYAHPHKRLLCWEERYLTTLKTAEKQTNVVVDSFYVYLLEILKLF